MANRVHTIGNSNRTSDEVLTILQKHEITDLVDVRSFSASRTNPQWNQNAIVDALPSAIRYRGSGNWAAGGTPPRTSRASTRPGG
ncbi:DUF488 family protein [Streptomyces griseoincarnatus]